MTRVMVSPFTLHSSPFTLKVSSLGSFGLAPPLAKTFLALLLLLLETYTEAYAEVAGTGGDVAALS